MTPEPTTHSWDKGQDHDRTVVPGMAHWRQLLADATERLRLAGIESPDVNARRIGEEACGRQSAAFLLGLDEPVAAGDGARFEAMLARRLAGEPLQYVVGRWGFRTLDLLVDHRVLIPRPETEQVVEEALTELDRVVHSFRAGENRVESTSNRRQRKKIVDLGCGSGAIGLSIAAEREDVDVWCVDASADAVAVTRQNLRDIGAAGARVTVLEGSWFEPLPAHLIGFVDLIVANPPYVAADDPLPAEVADWEPTAALVAGPTGLESIEHIVRQAPRWLVSGGTLVTEIGETQADRAAAAARSAGLTQVEIRRDVAGRDRTLIARRS